MVYHFCSSQDTDYRSDFKSFYESQEDLRGDGGNGKNFYSWYSSRLALLKCLDEMSMTLPINRLKVSNHLHIDNITHLRASMTHTEYDQGMFLSGAIVSHSSGHLSVGIDLEQEDREISEKIKNKFHHSQDENLEAIEIWIRKEASYKAITPLLKEKAMKPALFKEIAVSTSEFKFERDSLSYSGSLSQIKLEFDGRNFLAAIATIPA